MFNNRPIHHQETREWIEIERRLAALETKLVRIPMLTADPDADSGVNIWFREDINELKIRKEDGTVRRITTVA